MLIVLQGQKVIDRAIYLKTHPQAASQQLAEAASSAAQKQPSSAQSPSAAAPLDKAALQAKQS